MLFCLLTQLSHGLSAAMTTGPTAGGCTRSDIPPCVLSNKALSMKSNGRYEAEKEEEEDDDDDDDAATKLDGRWPNSCSSAWGR